MAANAVAGKRPFLGECHMHREDFLFCANTMLSNQAEEIVYIVTVYFVPFIFYD